MKTERAVVAAPFDSRRRASIRRDGAIPATWAASLFTVAFALVFAAVGSFTYRGHRYFTLFDDAMISMRFAANLAHGHGLVWNAGGAHVEGYTNFLWTLWMAVLHVVPGVSAADRALLVVATCTLLLIANLWVIRRVCRQIAPDRPAVANIAVWMTATAYPLLYWSLRGMEVALVATLTTSMALLALRWRDCHERRDLVAFSLVAIVAVLTRTDAVIPAATAGAFIVAWSPRGGRRNTVLAVGSAIVGILAVHTAFRSIYYGDPLPNTYYLKLGGAPLWPRLQRGLESLGSLACASLLPPLALASVSFIRRRRVDPPSALLAALFVMPAVYSIYVGGDAWEWLQYPNRYLATGLTLLLVLAALGLDDLTQLAPRTQTRIAIGGSVLLVAAVAAAGAEVIPTGMLQYSLPSTGDLPVRELLVAIAVILIALWLIRSRRGVRPGPWLIAVAAIAVMSGQGLVTWSATSGLHVADDNTMAIYGLELRQATSPDTTIAVVWAGAGPYFDGRPSVDLLGKSDPHIAKEAMRRGVTFYPGHTKWDYAWSIGHLRPDLVAGLVRQTPADISDLRGWGYEELRPGVWVRTDTPNVNRDLLVRLLDQTPRVGKLIDHDL